MKCRLVEKEFEDQAKYLTYEGTKTFSKPENEYKLVKFKYHKMVVEYFDVEDKSMMNDNSSLPIKEKSLCLS